MKKIIIIGGGFAGFNLALKLDKNRNFETLLIDPKDYFVYNPLCIEVSVGNIPPKAIIIPYKQIFKKVKHIKSRVEKINFTIKKVILKNNIEIKYDYLVIASGAKTVSNLKDSKKLLSLKTIEDAIKIKNILFEAFKKKIKIISIIGGGATGTELAAEIAYYFNKNKKSVKINHFISDRGYFPEYTHFNDCIIKKMNLLGVNIISEGKVISVNNNIIKTEKNNYKSDYIFLTIGTKPNLIEADIIFKVGYPINNFCEIIGLKDVYAIGDVSLLPYKKNILFKLAQIAKSQGVYLAKYINNKEKNIKSKPFKPIIFGVFISLGKYFAISKVLQKITFKGILPWLIKRIYYFIDIFSIIKRYKVFSQLIKSTISKKYLN